MSNPSPIDMKNILILLLTLPSIGIMAQLYFPPAGNAVWESIPSNELNWAEEDIIALDQFLEETNTKGFIYLKDGKIAKESYFNDFEQGDAWYWASAGKGITAFLIGMAQEQGILNLTDSSSQYLGDWTLCDSEEEDKIQIIHQLTMTSGLDFSGDIFCTDRECLSCLNTPGEEWYYHNAPYTLLDQVIESASGQTLNQYTREDLIQRTGMTGVWAQVGFNNLFLSTTRSMAKFGLLALNNGVWNGDTLLQDQAYFQDMISSSQDINPAYGYLWWLNGEESSRQPGSTDDFEGSLIPNAPDDLYMAIGANGQFIYVLPSTNEVIVRTGENTGDELVPILFGRALWDLVEQLNNTTSIQNSIASNTGNIVLHPNPSSSQIEINSDFLIAKVEIYDMLGNLLIESQHSTIYLQDIQAGKYIAKVMGESTYAIESFIKF